MTAARGAALDRAAALALDDMRLARVDGHGVTLDSFQVTAVLALVDYLRGRCVTARAQKALDDFFEMST